MSNVVKTIDYDSFTPKYMQIKEILAGEISRGEGCENNKMPSENVLPKRFKVSKATIIKALDELVKAGLVYRVKGKGTFITKQAMKTQINLATFGLPDWMLESLEQEFPKINLNLTNLTHENFFNVMETGEFDLLHVPDFYFRYCVTRGKLLDISDYVWPAAKSPVTAYDNVSRLFECRARQYAWPLFFSPIVVFYNRNLFKEASLRCPDEDWDVNDFLDLARRLTRNYAHGPVEHFGFVVSQYRNRWPVFVLQNGGRIISQPEEECVIDSPESIQAVSWVRDLFFEYRICPLSPQVSQSQAMKFFVDGRVGMILDTCYAFDMYRNTPFGVRPLPRQTHEVTGLIADGIAIGSKAADIAAAWKIIRFLASPDMQRRIKAHGLAVPADPEVAASGHDLPAGVEQGDYDIILRTVPYGRRLIDVSDPRVLEPLWENLDLVWANLESAPAACVRAARQVNRLLAGRQRSKPENLQ